MKENLEKISVNPSVDISPRSNPKSRSLRAVVITSNPAKFKEFKSVLGDGYGMDIMMIARDENMSVSQQCEQIMQTAAFTPHFILREESTLSLKDSGEDLTHLSMDGIAEYDLESVLHASKLEVYKPIWQETENGKKLTHFTKRDYEQRSYGFIDLDRKQPCVHGFGWDGIFVNATTNLTNEEYFNKYGKQSARQHTASIFIIEYLRYKALVSLKHHQIPATKPIDFGENYIHLTRFIKADPYLSNDKVNHWGIANLRNAMVNDGMFFKAAWSRAVKNYFSPPFSGLPLTAKQGAAEETIFGTHDMLHHAVPDLVCDVEPTKVSFQIYSAWRMISEACTLVMADMFYADSLIQTGVDRSSVDKRIHPLFEAIKEVNNIGDPREMSQETRLSFIKKLLFANMRYALHGDDSAWANLLKQADGQILPQHQARLDAYKNHFGKFFIGDNAWTRANYDNMNTHREVFDNWINNVGRDVFRNSNIPLLSDTCKALYYPGVRVDSYDAVSNAVFEHVFNTRIKPSLAKAEVNFDDEMIIQSRAFRRYLIGQVSIFSKYPTPINATSIKESILARLKSPEMFSIKEQNAIAKDLKRYILLLEGLRLMSRAEAKNAIDCVPVFPPVYISYSAMETQYQTIKNCVQQNIETYETPQKSQLYDGRLFSKIQIPTVHSASTQLTA